MKLIVLSFKMYFGFGEEGRCQGMYTKLENDDVAYGEGKKSRNHPNRGIIPTGIRIPNEHSKVYEKWLISGFSRQAFAAHSQHSLAVPNYRQLAGLPLIIKHE